MPKSYLNLIDDKGRLTSGNMWTRAVARSTPAPKHSRTEVTKALPGDWRWLEGTKYDLNQSGRRLSRMGMTLVSAITATLVHIKSMFADDVAAAVEFPVKCHIV